MLKEKGGGGGASKVMNGEDIQSSGTRSGSTIARRKSVGDRIGKWSGQRNSTGLSCDPCWTLIAFQCRVQSARSRSVYFLLASEMTAMGTFGAPTLFSKESGFFST